MEQEKKSSKKVLKIQLTGKEETQLFLLAKSLKEQGETRFFKLAIKARTQRKFSVFFYRDLRKQEYL